MKFENFLKLELKRLFSNTPYKMEAEKMMLDSINMDGLYHIDDFDNGLSSNLYDDTGDLINHITLFKLNQIIRYKPNLKVYNIKVVFFKEDKFYKLVFYLQNPITNKNYSNGGFFNIFGSNKPKRRKRKYRKRNYIIRYNKAKENKDLYKINYTNRDFRRIKKVDIDKCQTFDKFLNEELNLSKVQVVNIPKSNLLVNIFKSYYIVLFKYILPALYNDYTDFNINQNTVLGFDSILKFNDILNDSLDTIFFFSKNKKLYKEINQLFDDSLLDIPIHLNDIPVTITRQPMEYKFNSIEEEIIEQEDDDTDTDSD